MLVLQHYDYELRIGPKLQFHSKFSLQSTPSLIGTSNGKDTQSSKIWPHRRNYQPTCQHSISVCSLFQVPMRSGGTKLAMPTSRIPALWISIGSIHNLNSPLRSKRLLPNLTRTSTIQKGQKHKRTKQTPEWQRIQRKYSHGA